MKKIAFIFLLVLLCGTAQAQESGTLSLIFESEPGQRSFGLEVLIDGAAQLFDADGDGRQDLILTREDEQGNLEALRVVDLASGTTLWEVQDVQGLLTDDGTLVLFKGFADPDADGEREAVFVGDQDVVLINPTDNSLAWSCSNSLINMGADPNCLSVGISDMTGDGYEELIIYLPEMQVVQVWSKP